MKYQVEVTPYESYSSYYKYFERAEEAVRYAEQFQTSLAVVTEVAAHLEEV